MDDGVFGSIPILDSIKIRSNCTFGVFPVKQHLLKTDHLSNAKGAKVASELVPIFRWGLPRGQPGKNGNGVLTIHDRTAVQNLEQELWGIINLSGNTLSPLAG